jgi:hypothetical protein
MTIETIRVKDPEGPGWLIVEFQGFITSPSRPGVGALIKVGDTMPQPVEPEYIHPDDYKLLLERYKEING